MAATHRIGPMIAGPNGTYVAVMDDGSTVVYDSQLNQVGGDPSPNPMRAALMGSGDTAAAAQTIQRASTEDARRFDQNYHQRADEIGNSYRVNMMNARTNADQQAAQAQYQQDQTQLARERLSFERESQQQNLGLSQAKLGYDLIGTAANLRGPANFYQASEYARGVSAQPQTSTFLSALQNNTNLAGYGAQGGLPERETVGSLTAKLGGGTGIQNGAPTEDNTLAQIGNIAAKGAHQLSNGSLESLTPTEYGLFTSGLDRLGVDKDTFLSQYRRSRVGQSFGNSAAA